MLRDFDVNVDINRLLRLLYKKMTEHLMTTCMIVCVRKMRLVSGKLDEVSTALRHTAGANDALASDIQKLLFEKIKKNR